MNVWLAALALRLAPLVPLPKATANTSSTLTLASPAVLVQQLALWALL
jgi:hypothetical protein